MNDERAMLNIRIDAKLKKELKLISVYEDLTITEIVDGFIKYGVKKYHTEQILINDK